MGTSISSLFNNASAAVGTQGSAYDLADYAAIRNGSYGKLLKAHYAKEKAEKTADSGDSPQKLAGIRANADALKSSADALQDSKLWEKKEITKKNEETGEEETSMDYDWEAITGAVKKFAESYNSLLDASGNSDTKGVLQNATWLIGMTASNAKLLAKAGIEIGADNKLTVHEEDLKKADLSTVSLLFRGHNSFADKAASKASGIDHAATRAGAASGSAYDRKGAYSSPLSDLAKSKIDAAIGGKEEKTTADTSDVDQEIKELKARKEKLEKQIKAEYSAEKRREYEKELKLIEKELAYKDSDFYRKQNSVFT